MVPLPPEPDAYSYILQAIAGEDNQCSITSCEATCLTVNPFISLKLSSSVLS